MENYGLFWKTKSACLNLKGGMDNLADIHVETLDFCGKGNLYITGDSLDALKYLSTDYTSKIKMIYIDPPYNTGKKFVYNDDYRLPLKAGKDNGDLNGSFHNKWLDMMYPRLLAARELLSDDGVVFISIGAFELGNLKLLCAEVFGDENFVDIFVWSKTSTPPSLSKKTRQTVEFIVCYEKNRNGFKYYGETLQNGDAPLINSGNAETELAFPKGTLTFNGFEKGRLKAGDYKKARVLNDIEVCDDKNQNEVLIAARFKWNQDNLRSEIGKGTTFVVKNTDRFSIRFKRSEAYASDNFKPPTNHLNGSNGVGTNESAKKELSKLGMSDWFDYPKPVSLIKKLIKMVMYNDKTGIILDFFSGSGTTGQAVMELNHEDGGERRFIMVEQQMDIPKDNPAAEFGLTSISSIGVERVKRAWKQIGDSDGSV